LFAVLVVGLERRATDPLDDTRGARWNGLVGLLAVHDQVSSLAASLSGALAREASPDVGRLVGVDPVAGPFTLVALRRPFAEFEQLAKNPELDITPNETAGSTAEYLGVGRNEGIKALEDKIEELAGIDIESFADDPDGIIENLGMLTAYLELTKDVNEDAIDLERFD